MRKCTAKVNKRQSAGFTLAEVLIALLVSVILGALVANLGFSMTQTARQSALDRQAESIYESASRNLTSIAIAGEMDTLREAGVAVWNKFDNITSENGSTVRVYYDHESDQSDISKEYAIKYKEMYDVLEPVQSSNADTALNTASAEEGESSEGQPQESGVVESNDKWKVEAAGIASGIAEGDDPDKGGVYESDFKIYCLTSENTSPEAKRAAELLLGSGVVSSDVLDDEWCVFYAVDNNYDYATVLETWYTTPEYAGKLPDEYSFAKIAGSNTEKNIENEMAREALRGPVDRKSKSDGHVGYYGAGSDELFALPSAKIADPSDVQCWMLITNAERLVAHLYCYVPENGAGYYNGGYTNFVYSLGMTSGSHPNTLALTGQDLSRSKSGGVNNGYPVSVDGEIRGYYYNIGDVVLDSLVSEEESFSRFVESGFKPGEDVTLSLNVACGSDSAALIAGAGSVTGDSEGAESNPSGVYSAKALPGATQTVNSLFESVTPPEGENGTYTIQVGYGRHLQNLDNAVSGLNLPSDANIKVVQVRNVYFNGKDNTGDYTELGDFWSDEDEQWAVVYKNDSSNGETAGGAGTGGTETGTGGTGTGTGTEAETDIGNPADLSKPVMTFAPIFNDKIVSYSGADGVMKVIEDLTVDNSQDFVALHRPSADFTRKGFAGLFGQFKGQKLENITLIDPVVDGGANCMYAGGLVGQATESLSVDSCALRMNTLVDKEAKADEGAVRANKVDWVRASESAGGLVGYASQNISINGSYAATVVEATEEGSYAGGLVGEVDGSATVSGSYADCYIGATHVGGLVGTVGVSGQGTFTVGSQSYSAGFVLGSVHDAGKFVGKSDVVLNGENLKDSYSVFSFTDPFGSGDPSSYFDNGVPTPNVVSSEEPGNGYYLSSFDAVALDVWPYPTLGLPHYGDWTEYQQALLLKVENGEKLTVWADNLVGAGYSKDLTATITMYGLTSGKSHTWEDKVEKLDNAVKTLDALYDGSGGSSERFKTQFEGEDFLPGENILLWLTVKNGDTVVYPNASKGEKLIGYVTNSIFAYGENNIESQAVTADTVNDLMFKAENCATNDPVSGPKQGEHFKSYIAAGRHLQNLDFGQFGFSPFTYKGTSDPDRLDTVEADDVNVDAKQVKDIDWEKEYKARPFVSIIGSDDKGYVKVDRYDGGDYEIRNMGLIGNNYIDGMNREADAYVGLFGVFDGHEIKSTKLLNVKVLGDEDVLRNIDAAGALVGKLANLDEKVHETLRNVVIDGCSSRCDFTAGDDGSSESYIRATLYAGGLIGMGIPHYEDGGAGSLTIKHCYAASSVCVTGYEGRKGSQPGYCGGLLGSVDFDENILMIENSYADCNLTVSGLGDVGGLVGECNKSGNFTNCYSAGIASGTYSKAAGLAPQQVNKVDNCYSALFYESESVDKNDLYGLVKDVVGATDSNTGTNMRDEAPEGSSHSYYTFKNVNDDSVVWSNAEDSLFSYVKGEFLQDYLDMSQGFEMGGGTPYSSDLEGQSYPYPTLKGLPHYGDWREDWSLDLSGYGLKVHLQVPKRGSDGKIETNEQGDVKKYELGEVLYRTENLADFMTVINPYYLAYLYQEQGKSIPSELNEYIKSSGGQFLTTDEQSPVYPDPNDTEGAKKIEKLIVGVGTVGNNKSSAIESTDEDKKVQSELDRVLRTVIPDAADWNNNHSVSRYFLIPAKETEQDFFTVSHPGETADERVYRQSYRYSDAGAVFFAGYGGGSSSASTALDQKSSGFGESIGKQAVNEYIDTYGDNDGVVGAQGSSVYLKREKGNQASRKTVMRYEGECSAYLEWCPKVTLKSIDPTDSALYPSTPTGDFEKDAKDVLQYVKDGNGNYLNENGEVVSDKADAATKTAELHYANFGTERASGAYFSDASMSSSSLVREQASSASVDAFLNRYKGFDFDNSSGGNKVLTSADKNVWFLGFGFNAGDSYAQVYNNRGMVPRSVVDGGRYIDRDYVAYAHYGYAVTLKMRLPVRLHDGTQLYRLSEPDTISMAGIDENGKEKQFDTRCYVRKDADTNDWIKVDPDTFEDEGGIALDGTPTPAFTDQVVGYVYYGSRTSNLGSAASTGYSYKVEVNDGATGAVTGGSEIVPEPDKVASLWGLASSKNLKGYRFVAAYDTNEDESELYQVKTESGNVKEYITSKRIGNTDKYIYSLSEQLYDNVHTLKGYRNPETRETSAYAYWDDNTFVYDDYDTSSLQVVQMPQVEW